MRGTTTGNSIGGGWAHGGVNAHKWHPRQKPKAYISPTKRLENHVQRHVTDVTALIAYGNVLAVRKMLYENMRKKNGMQ